MDSFQLRLLEEVKSGTQCFEPENLTPEAMREFQKTALALIDLKDAGYLVCIPKTETFSGQHHYVTVMVISLTYKGVSEISDENAQVRKERENRRQILQLLWKKFVEDGGEISDEDIVHRLALSLERANSAIRYLEKQGYIETTCMHSGYEVTSLGIQVYEQMVSNPDSTPQGLSISQTIHGNVGAIQTGTKNIASVNQNISRNPEEVLLLIDALRKQTSSLPEAVQAEATENIDNVKEEVASPTPSKSKLKSFLLSLLSAGAGVTDFTNNVVGIAQALKIQGLTFP